MRRIIFTFICCMLFMAATAQRITCEYNNVSLSEALRQLNEQSEEYTISFLYNELEDFRITTSVHHKTVPEAIRQMIGFYPIRMSIDSTEITVECPQKTANRYKGTIIDEQGQPVAYANIAMKAVSLLFPANKNQSLQEYLLSATRRFTSNATMQNSVLYGCSQKHKR